MSEPSDPREQLGEHGEWDALAVGWALSALDPEDEERFAEHLPGCARCTATVRESLYTVADLAYALPDEAPPASLKSRLMAAVAAEPRTPGAAAEPEAPAEPEAAEEWPLGEPHPGSPGYGIDWFARPARGAEPGEPGPAGRTAGRAEDRPPTAEPTPGDTTGPGPEPGGPRRRTARRPPNPPPATPPGPGRTPGGPAGPPRTPDPGRTIGRVSRRGSRATMRRPRQIWGLTRRRSANAGRSRPRPGASTSRRSSPAAPT